MYSVFAPSLRSSESFQSYSPLTLTRLRILGDAASVMCSHGPQAGDEPRAPGLCAATERSVCREREKHRVPLHVWKSVSVPQSLCLPNKPKQRHAGRTEDQWLANALLIDSEEYWMGAGIPTVGLFELLLKKACPDHWWWRGWQNSHSLTHSHTHSLSHTNSLSHTYTLNESRHCPLPKA